MVVAVRCPAAACRKYMLVEDADQGQIVPCLICKTQIRVPASAGVKPPIVVPPQPELSLAPEPASDVFLLPDPDPPGGATLPRPATNIPIAKLAPPRTPPRKP